MATKYSDPVFDILKGGVTIAATIALPELVPFIGPAFTMVKGIMELVEAIRNRNEPDTFELLQRNLNALRDDIKDLGLKQEEQNQLNSVDPHYIAIVRLIEKYQVNAKSINYGILADELYYLQQAMTEPGVGGYRQPWTAFLSNICQIKSASSDATWGFETAYLRFVKMLGLQEMAISILKKEGIGAEKYVCSIQKQVDLFKEEFVKQWDSDVGKMQLVNITEGVDSLCYGDISDDHFYWFVKSQTKNESALLKINLKKLDVETPAVFPFANYDKEYRICVHENKLYTVDSSSKKLCSITLEKPYKPEYDICQHMLFYGQSQMVCRVIPGNDTSAKRTCLYAVNRDNELCEIDLDNNNSTKFNRHQWSDSTALAIDAGSTKIYGIADGCLGKHSFFTVDSSVFDSFRSELNPGCCFTSMAMTVHGTHLYAIDGFKICAYDTKRDLSSKPIPIPNDYKSHVGKINSVHLMSHKLTLYLQVNTRKGKSMSLYCIKPYWPMQGE